MVAFALALGYLTSALEAQSPPAGGDRTRLAAATDVPDALHRVWVPKWQLTNGPHVRASFRDVVSGPSRSTVRVLAGDKDAALGGIVGPDGWILTKASLLSGPLTCRLQDGRELDAQVVGVHRDYDLAMLKVSANELPALEFPREDTAEVGQWVATPGLGRDPIAVGIVSVGTREIPRRAGILGVQLDETDDGPSVERVFPDTGAEIAGVLINDVIESINGKQTPTRQALISQIRRYSPGDELTLGIRRGDETIQLRAILSGRLDDGALSRRQYQNELGGELSQRRFGFKAAFQHDSVLHPTDCGGPLVNLDGQVIGVNVARAGRTESFAIPSSVVVALLYDLMSGNLAPDNAQRQAEPPKPEQ